MASCGFHKGRVPLKDLMNNKQTSMKHRLGALVAEARTNHQLDQTELGHLIGLKKSVVSKIENGERALTGEELLTLTLIFKDWFEFRSESFMEDITADLAARLRDVVETKVFTPLEAKKEVWFQRLLGQLDSAYGEATA